MKVKFCSYSIMLIFVICLNTYASDTTYKKNSWYLSLNVGYGSNTVCGSMWDLIKDNSGRNATIEQMNTWSFFFNVAATKYFGKFYYFKAGLGYSHKNVDPEENSPVVYKDSLNTSYLTVPVLVGVRLPLNKKRDILFILETGLAGNFKLADKTYSGPDRVSFEANPVVLSYQASGGFEMVLNPKTSFLMQYLFSADLTNAYKETLYVGYNKAYYYKYLTNAFSLGLKWRI